MSDDSLLWTRTDQPRAADCGRESRSGQSERTGVTWSVELRYHGEYDVEAQIVRSGELSIGRQFPLKAQAVRWAEEERSHVGERLEDWIE